MSEPAPAANYAPEVFDVRDVDEARRIILTPEAGTTTDARWAAETPWLADRILERFPLTEQHVVIDFGCGLGRMARALIERTRCWVIGVDMSRSMRQLAPGYVESAEVRRGVAAGARSHDRAGAFVPSWRSRSGCCSTSRDRRTTWRACERVLAPGGGVFVANNLRRAVPTDRGWAHDGVDVEALLAQAFTPAWRGVLPSDIGGEVLPQASFLGAYMKSAVQR